MLRWLPADIRKKEKGYNLASFTNTELQIAMVVTECNLTHTLVDIYWALAAGVHSVCQQNIS